MKKSSYKKYFFSGIKPWLKEDRPREKLFREGEHRLSKTGLLAILLRSGIKGESAIDLSRKILQKFKTFRNMSHTYIRDWKEFKGLGQAKIAQIKAAIEIGRRFKEELPEDNPRIKSSKDVTEILIPRMRDLKKEVFKTMLLNSRNGIIDIMEVTEGTVNQATPIIREVFQKALQKFATSIICVHNHPGGDPTPSEEDKNFTKELVKAGKVLQINVLDHIIVGGDEYYSFSDEGEIGDYS